MYLKELGKVVDYPWMLIGDFNQILNKTEKKGGKRFGSKRAKAFAHMIEECELHDLGFSRPRFTWCNLRKGPERVQERLDRALENDKWLLKYQDNQVIHLPRSRSNHNPIMVRDNGHRGA